MRIDLTLRSGINSLNLNLLKENQQSSKKNALCAIQLEQNKWMIVLQVNTLYQHGVELVAQVVQASRCVRNILEDTISPL